MAVRKLPIAKAINEALVSAQQLRNEIREQSEKEGQLIIREAKADAEKLLDDARGEIRRMEDQIASLDRARRSFLAQMRLMIERQLSDVNAAEQATSGDNAREGGAGSPSWMGSLVKE